MIVLQDTYSVENPKAGSFCNYRGFVVNDNKLEADPYCFLSYIINVYTGFESNDDHDRLVSYIKESHITDANGDTVEYFEFLFAMFLEDLIDETISNFNMVNDYFSFTDASIRSIIHSNYKFFIDTDQTDIDFPQSIMAGLDHCVLGRNGILLRTDADLNMLKLLCKINPVYIERERILSDMKNGIDKCIEGFKRYKLIDTEDQVKEIIRRMDLFDDFN